MECNAKRPSTSLSRRGVGFLDNRAETPESDRAGRSVTKPWRRQGHWGISLPLTGLATLLLVVTSTDAAAGPTPCRLLFDFNPLEISAMKDNTYLPRMEGYEYVWRKDNGGSIRMRIPNMRKRIKFDSGVIDAQVIWEEDLDSADNPVEKEIRMEGVGGPTMIGPSFIRWNLAETIEEPTEDGFDYASSWMTGFRGGQGGHLMLDNPQDKTTHQNKIYLQAFADDEENIIGDCAKVTDVGVTVEGLSVEIINPAGEVIDTFEGCEDAVVIRESSTASSGEGGVQVKYYCPGVGVVLIDGQGGPDGQEMAELESIRDVTTNCAGDIASWQEDVLGLEQRAYAAGALDNDLSPAPYVCDGSNCPNHDPIADPCPLNP